MSCYRISFGYKPKISQDGIDKNTAGKDDRRKFKFVQIRRKPWMPRLQELGCCVKSQVTSCSSPEQGMDSWTDVTAPIRSHSLATPLYGEVWKQIKTIGTWLQKHHWTDSREGCCQERVGHNKHYPWQEMKKFRLPEERSILCSLRSLQNLCQGCVTGSQHCFAARTWIKPPGRASGGKVEVQQTHSSVQRALPVFPGWQRFGELSIHPTENKKCKSLSFLCVCCFFLFISIKNKGLRRVHTHHTHAMI